MQLGNLAGGLLASRWADRETAPRIAATVDGAVNPGAIPDAVAYGHFIRATASSTSPTDIIQKALHVLDGVYHLSGFIGATFTATPREFPGPRGVVAPIEIYLERIREVSPTANDRTTPDLIDSTAISKVIAHEIGHGVTIDHIVIPPPPQCDQSQPNPVPLTVMTSQVFVQTTSATHPCWLPANIPTGFQSGDIDQLQLR